MSELVPGLVFHGLWEADIAFPLRPLWDPDGFVGEPVKAGSIKSNSGPQNWGVV